MLIGTCILLIAFAVLVADVILLGVVVSLKLRKPSAKIAVLRDFTLYFLNVGYGIAGLGLLICFLEHVR